MSKMKDMWGDTIEVFTEEANMELDADLARKFVKKLKKAIAEVEDM